MEGNTMSHVARLREGTDDDWNVDKQPAAQPVAQPPTAERAKGDGIAAIVDSLSASLTGATASVRKLCDRYDRTAMQHAARVKLELTHFVEAAEAITADATALGDRIERLEAEHAKILNARTTE